MFGIIFAVDIQNLIYFSFIMKFLKKKKYGKVLSVDIGNSTIKFLVTEGRYPDTLKVLDYRLVNIDTEKKTISQEELQEIIKHNFQSLDYKPNEVRTLLKPQQEVVRMVDLPDGDDDELKKAAGYQLNRYVPFGRGEAIYDCTPIEGVSVVNGMRKCVLVAIRRGSVEQHYKLFETANIIPVIIDVESVAVMNSYITASATFNKKNQIPVDNQNVALVHIGASHTGLSVMRGEIPVASRAINIGADNLVSQAKEILNVKSIVAIDKMADEQFENSDIHNITTDFVSRICKELNASLLYCKRELDVETQGLYITGGAAVNKLIRNTISEIIGLPVYLFNPFENIELSALGERSKDFIKNTAAFVPLFALAVRESSEA